MSDSQKKEAAPEPVVVNKWDGSAVKNAIDDAIKEVFTTDLKLEESFALMDGRLVLCGLAVSIGLISLLWDYLYPFPQSRLVLVICVTCYFALTGVLSLYTTFKEKGIFVIVKDKTSVCEASSYVKKYDDKYQLVLNVQDVKSGKLREAGFTKSFANFIDSNGSIVQQTIQSEVLKVYNSLLSEKKEK